MCSFKTVVVKATLSASGQTCQAIAILAQIFYPYSPTNTFGQTTDPDGKKSWGFCSYHCSLRSLGPIHSKKLQETLTRWAVWYN